MGKEENMSSALGYDSIAMRRVENAVIRQFTASILLSSLEDADVEFYEDDYDEWKKLRKRRQKKSEVFKEKDYAEEFELKQKCKELFFTICGMNFDKTAIPKKYLNEREMYENNSMKDLMRMTNFEKGTLMNNAKLHGWKIGSNYKEPTIFDL